MLNYTTSTLFENAVAQHLAANSLWSISDGPRVQLEAIQHLSGVPYPVLTRCLAESCLTQILSRVGSMQSSLLPDHKAAASLRDETNHRYPVRVETAFVNWVHSYIRYGRFTDGPFEDRLRQFLRAVIIETETTPNLWDGWADDGIRSALADMIAERLTLTEQAQAKAEAEQKIRAAAEARSRAADAARAEQVRADAKAARRAAAAARRAARVTA